MNVRFYRILGIFILVLLVIAVAGILYTAALFREVQNTHDTLGEYELPELEHETMDTRRSLNSAYFHAVDFLVTQMTRNEMIRELNTILAGTLLAAFKDRQAFVIRHEAGIHWEKNGRTWFSFSPSETQDFIVHSRLGRWYSFTTADPGLLTFLEEESTALTEHFVILDRLPALFRALLREQALTAELRSRNLIVTALEETQHYISAHIQLPRGRGASALHLSLDKRDGIFRIGNDQFTDIDSFYSSLLSAVQEMDLRSLDDFHIEQGKREIEELFNDSGFIAYLETMNLVLSREPREIEDFILYDLLALDSRIGSIGVHIKAGGVYLLDEEYISLGAIQTFGIRSRDLSAGTEFDFETLPDGQYERGNIHTVLIAGANERMTDTLILAIINEDTQDIDLISLPRDLFFGNIKINDIYSYHGPRRLVTEMEKMTGFAIDNYIIIDMFAFIDVINILGGIEITLNVPLVDPTYRVRDNGQWSTLFYPAGRHHLNGIEALRIARSRHFISDFGRSRHQQLILRGIIEKITSMGASDIGKAHELALVFLRYVETDYTPGDVIRNTIRFRSARVRNQAVFDTGNILYSTYANLWRLNLRMDEVDEDFYLGQYILLPFNNNWSLIHRFIRSVIEDPVAPSRIPENLITADNDLLQ